MKKPGVVIVTGMHRSGTSLAAQWMHRCELHLGDHLLGAHIGNKEGHFEDLDFLQLHEQILTELGLPETGLVKSPLPPLKDVHIRAISRLVAIKKSNQHNWGWKEPRTCLFLPYYRMILPDAFYLILIRDYEMVVSSLIMRLYRRAEKKYAGRRGLHRWLWIRLKQKRRIHYLLRTKATLFLQSWLLYNQAIQRLLASLPAEQYLVADQQTLMQHSAPVFAYIREHAALTALRYVPFSELFRPELQSEPLDIKAFIKDKTLLQEADRLQGLLKAHIFKAP